MKQLTDAVEYGLSIGVLDADSMRVILEHRREAPVTIFSLEGRPHSQDRACRNDGHRGLPISAGGGIDHEKDRNEKHGVGSTSS